jgi:hypothetical protein
VDAMDGGGGGAVEWWRCGCGRGKEIPSNGFCTIVAAVLLLLMEVGVSGSIGGMLLILLLLLLLLFEILVLLAAVPDDTEWESECDWMDALMVIGIVIMVVVGLVRWDGG